MEIKISMQRVYLIMLFIWAGLFVLVNQNTISGTLETYLKNIYVITWYIIRLLIILKIIMEFERKDLKILIILFIGLITFYKNGSTFLTSFLWFLAGAKGVSIKYSIKSILYSQILSVGFIFILAYMGIIENTIYLRSNGGIRYSMGFDHPNTFAARILQIEIIYFYLRNKKINLLDGILIFLIGYMSYMWTNSRTALYMTILIVIYIILYVVFKRFNIKRIFNYLFSKLIKLSPLGFLGILILLINFNKLIPTLDNFISGTLLSRVNLMGQYLQNYKIKLFGQVLEITYKNKDIYSTTDFFTLDNSYLYLLLGFGIVNFTLFFLAYIKSIKILRSKGDNFAIYSIILFFIFGLFETMFIRFSFNFTLVFLFYAFWEENLNWFVKKG